MKRFTALLISLWLGMQLGFFAASAVLFNQLDKADAGRIAGILFHIANLTGLLAWGAAFWVCRANRDWGSSFSENRPTRRWIALLLALLALSQFLLNPAIHALKTGESHFLVRLVGGSFGTWHGSSYMVSLLMSIIGLGLCIRLLRLDVR